MKSTVTRGGSARAAVVQRVPVHGQRRSREPPPTIGGCRGTTVRESRSSEPDRGSSGPRRVPAELRDVAFPVSVRGYDRRAVEMYVIRVNRVIAELEATRSPEAAVNRALRHTEEQREGILGQARETAERITAAAQREGDEVTAKARAEAVDIVVNAGAEADRASAEADEHCARARIEADKILTNAREEAAAQLQHAQEEIVALRKEAEAWVHELRTDTEAVWGERRDLLDELREIAGRLQEAVSGAATRAGSRGGSAV
jgi:cell division septum initiation protein DivIVA